MGRTGGTVTRGEDEGLSREHEGIPRLPALPPLTRVFKSPVAT